MVKDTKYAQGRWTAKEKYAIEKAMLICGKNWVAISKMVETRSSVQCRTHYLKSLIGERTRVVRRAIQKSQDIQDSGLVKKEGSENSSSFKHQVSASTAFEELSDNPCMQGEEIRSCTKDDFTTYPEDLFEYLMF